MDQELTTLIQRLKDNEKGCENQCLDLQTLKFEAKEGAMRLYNEFHSYWFRHDPKNPRDPRIIHAAKQFCKLMGMPHPFFSKNPDHMKNQMVSTWLPTLKPEKAVILSKMRHVKDNQADYQIRAILPVEFSPMDNSALMALIGDAIQDTFKTDFIIGDSSDDLILNVRFVSIEFFDVGGEHCHFGFSVIASDLGASPLSVETYLYRGSSKSSIIASYGGEAYFESDYTGMQPTTISQLFPQLMIRLPDHMKLIRDRVYSARAKVTATEDVAVLLRNLKLRKGIPDKFHILMFQDIEVNPVGNRWEFANRMSILAKDFDIMTRVKIERAAGEIIDLQFEKV